MSDSGSTSVPAASGNDTTASTPPGDVSPAASRPAVFPGGQHVNELAALVADLLEPTGLVSPDRLAAARGRAGRGSLAQALVDEGLASAEGVARARAERYQLPFVDIMSISVSPDAIEQIPLPVLRRTEALPYEIGNNTLRIAIADPGDIAGIDELRMATRLSVELAVASRDDLLAELQRVRHGPAKPSTGRTDVDFDDFETVDDEDDLEAEDGVSDAPIVRLVNSLIFQAAEDGASDVHIEPQEDLLLVRFRIDGVLHEVQRIPKRLSNAVTTRLKVLAKMDIAERRRPQDGRISLNAVAAGRRLDVRIATLPTVEGESVVMRLLDKSKRAPTLEELGLSPDMRELLGRSCASRPARCSSPGRPDRESRRLSTPRSPRSTGPRSTSSPSRTRSSTAWRA